MGLYEHWPYLNYHDLNLNWILGKIHSFEDHITNLQVDIKRYVDQWLDAHPEATTTVQDGAITKVKLNSSLSDQIVFRNGINKQFTSENIKLGSISHTSAQIQGMTTDGTYLYLAGTDGDTSHPIIYVVDPSDLSIVTTHTLNSVYGHPNSLDYCNGYLYISGCMPTAVTTTYEYICKVSTSTWTQTLISLVGATRWWSVALLKAYNNKYVLAGHRDSTGVLDLYATVYQESGTVMGLNKFMPWRQIDISAFSCDPAGMCQYGRFILIGDAHLSGSLANNAIRIFTHDGDYKATLYIPSMEDNELEDCCVLGTDLYINDISGNIYKSNLGDVLDRNFDSGMCASNLNAGVQFIYMNENGSETYTDIGSGDAKILSSFRCNPWFFPSKHWITGGTMVVHNVSGLCVLQAEYKEDGRITFNGTTQAGSALVSYIFRYTRTVHTDEYQYDLSEAYVTSHYGGVETHYADLDAAADAGYFDGYTYIRELIAEAAPHHSTSPIVL